MEVSTGGLNHQPNFQNGGGLTRPQLLQGDCWERGGDFFQGEVAILYINKLKSEIFNDKKSLAISKIFQSWGLGSLPIYGVAWQKSGGGVFEGGYCSACI